MSSQAVSVKLQSEDIIKQFWRRHAVVIKKTAFIFLFMIAGFALARIELTLGMAPFGPAFVAACFFSRRTESLFSAAGVCLGALLVPQSTLYIVTVTLIIATTLICIGQLRLKRWITLLTTASAFAVSAAVFKTAGLNVYMPAVLECLISLVMIYVFSSLIEIGHRGRRRSIFTVEETICLSLGALIAVIMFGPLNISGVYVAYIAAHFFILCVAYIGGAALGAGVGLSLGLGLCVGIHAEPVITGMMGILGLLAGTIHKLGKTGTATGYVFVGLLFVAAFYSSVVWYNVLIEAAAAALLFLLIPRKAFAFAGRYIDIKTKHDFEYKLHVRRVKELTVKRLLEVSDVFVKTGDMFINEARHNLAGSANISSALSVVADSTCKDCVFRKSCWDRDFLATYSVFSQLLSAYEKKGAVDQTDIPPLFVKKCYNIKGILSAAQNVFGAYLLSLKWQKKLEDSRIITGRQLRGVANVVAELGREMDTGFKFLPAVEEKVARALGAVNVRVKEVCAERAANGLTVGVKLKTEAAGACNILSVLSRACGMPMQKTNETNEKGMYRTLLFEQAHKYRAETAVAFAAKGEVSGDSHIYGTLKDGRYIMMLCDGMGSGEGARRESAATISLVENFFRAGFDDSVIFDTINKLLILRGNEDVFSTVDLCVLDLRTGDAKFTKIGAECAYILNKEGIATIQPGALPIGIIDEVAPLCTIRKLMAGDMIVMLSDGAADAINEDTVAWFCDITQQSAQETANAILDKARAQNAPQDDMTVMVCRISETQ
ncbi:MAG: stage II sporulation protein E [Christensenellales bacterium]